LGEFVCWLNISPSRHKSTCGFRCIFFAQPVAD
jgi:hypothetical protein